MPQCLASRQRFIPLIWLRYQGIFNWPPKGGVLFLFISHLRRLPLASCDMELGACVMPPRFVWSRAFAARMASSDLTKTTRICARYRQDLIAALLPASFCPRFSPRCHSAALGCGSARRRRFKRKHPRTGGSSGCAPCRRGGAVMPADIAGERPGLGSLSNIQGVGTDP